MVLVVSIFFFFSSRRRHTRYIGDWSSDVCSSDLDVTVEFGKPRGRSPERQYFDFKAALEALFGRSVDLVELAAMPDSRLKRYIERSQVRVYGKRPDALIEIALRALRQARKFLGGRTLAAYLADDQC